MSGFTVPAPAQPAPPVADAITGDAWQPAISIASFRDAMRIPTAVTTGRCRDALLGAALSVAIALAGWRQQQQGAGATGIVTATLAPGLPATIGGEPTAEALWRRAAFHFAAADLADTHNDISATDAGRARREERATAADELRRNAIVAIRDLIGRGRAKVALV